MDFIQAGILEPRINADADVELVVVDPHFNGPVRTPEDFTRYCEALEARRTIELNPLTSDDFHL